MKKNSTKRFFLELFQHLLAAEIMLVVAVILYNSYIGVESMGESHTYWVDALNTEPVFEDTAVYERIISTDAADVIHLVALRAMMEEDGEFAPKKKIDVTALANQGKEDPNCPVTAFYYLEDLIKWGKNEVEYHERSMSISDFVNYFEDETVVNPDYFALDNSGKLYFAGFDYENAGNYYSEFFEKKEDGTDSDGAGEEDAFDGEDAGENEERQNFYEIYLNYRDNRTIDDAQLEKLTDVEKKMLKYGQNELEQMAFSYIMSRNLNEFSIAEEDDGIYTVRIKMLQFEHETVDKIRLLTEYADNWIDYAYLQRNLVSCIESLSDGYDMYLSGIRLYGSGKSNFIYAIRMPENDGVKTYTNLPELKKFDDNGLTEDISEYRRFLVYYLDNLEFTGFTCLTEGDLFRFMGEANYTFPDNLRIWMAVDTSYSVEGDALYQAFHAFDRVVPNIPLLIAVIVILGLLWIGIFAHLAATTGIRYDGEGERVYTTQFFDKVWTELHFAMTGAFLYGIYRIQQELFVLVDATNELSTQFPGEKITGFYEYGVFALFGFGVSIVFDLLWFGIIRRIRGKTLKINSFVFLLWRMTNRGYNFITRHSNSAISTLIPYNAFLLVNLLGMFFIFGQIDGKNVNLVILVAVSLIVFDVFVGVRIFRNNAEKNDIVAGINRIRAGEVDYKLDVKSLSGINREFADAVNNIGEGIRNAVNTSMKDEQMKSDLITNVSHDLKTPLTSIISYVDLLKRTNVEDDNAKCYIEILDSKAQRLKQLTDDLVEASKISSGNITLTMERIDLAELINQTIGEFSEKMEEKNLEVVFTSSSKHPLIFADSRRMWRIIDNLFNNIYKYTMENTRVYVEISQESHFVYLSLKNISARQINLKGEELAERFIRGDESRTTEGSGLGLFISKSLTQAQAGSFSIQLDGDLFKVILRFPEYAL